MASGGNDPWGNGGGPWGGGRPGRPRRDAVPEFDDWRRQGRELWGKIPGGAAGGLGLLAVVLLALVAWSSYYTVPSDSVAVVQRFGRYLKNVPPGLHFRFPFGIDRTTIVPVQRQLKQEFGFLGETETDLFQPSRDERRESEMVTGDLNAALVEWVVQYRIAIPREFLFEVRDPVGTLRHVSESVMREVVGDRTVDEVLTIGRQEIEIEAQEKMQNLSTRYGMGISIDQVQLKNINPPGPVQASFNEVNQAQQEKERLINEARRDYNKVIPLAQGQRDQRIREAEGYRIRRINEAEGDAARFGQLLGAYLQAPDVTRRRIYLETLQRVLPAIGAKTIIDEDTGSILPLLDLSGRGDGTGGPVQ